MFVPNDAADREKASWAKVRLFWGRFSSFWRVCAAWCGDGPIFGTWAGPVPKHGQAWRNTHATCCASHTRGGVEHGTAHEELAPAEMPRSRPTCAAPCHAPCNAPHDGRCDVGDRSATVVWHGRCLAVAFGQNLKVGFGLHLGLFKPVCCSPPQPPLRHSGPFLVRAQRSSGIGDRRERYVGPRRETCGVLPGVAHRSGMGLSGK